MIIDIDKLRKDMLDNCYALFFSADTVAALAETPDIERASDEELIEMAQKQGIDLRKYEIWPRSFDVTSSGTSHRHICVQNVAR